MESLLYRFRYRDPLTGRWVRARYMATVEDISQRYATWELTGRAEVRRPIDGWFSPHGKLVTHAELRRLEEPPLTINPHLDRAAGNGPDGMHACPRLPAAVRHLLRSPETVRRNEGCGAAASGSVRSAARNAAIGRRWSGRRSGRLLPTSTLKVCDADVAPPSWREQCN